MPFRSPGPPTCHSCPFRTNRRGSSGKSSGELLRARRARNLTQQMLAELAGVSQGVVSRLVSGGHSPTLETLDQMARAMDYRLEVRLVENRRSRAARNRRQTPA